MSLQLLKNYLDTNNVKYIYIQHSKAHSPEEIRNSEEFKGQFLAKTVPVKVEGENAIIIVPSQFTVDVELLQQITGKGDVKMLKEEEIKECYPNCDPAAVPPFGNLFNVDVYIAKTLVQNKEFLCTAYSYREVIKMSYKDFEKLVSPLIGHSSINETYMKYISASEYFLC